MDKEKMLELAREVSPLRPCLMIVGENDVLNLCNAIEAAIREEYSLDLAHTIDQLRLMEIQLDTLLSHLDKR